MLLTTGCPKKTFPVFWWLRIANVWRATFLSIIGQFSQSMTVLDSYWVADFKTHLDLHDWPIIGGDKALQTLAILSHHNSGKVFLGHLNTLRHCTHNSGNVFLGHPVCSCCFRIWCSSQDVLNNVPQLALLYTKPLWYGGHIIGHWECWQFPAKACVQFLLVRRVSSETLQLMERMWRPPLFREPRVLARLVYFNTEFILLISDFVLKLLSQFLSFVFSNWHNGKILVGHSVCT